VIDLNRKKKRKSPVHSFATPYFSATTGEVPDKRSRVLAGRVAYTTRFYADPTQQSRCHQTQPIYAKPSERIQVQEVYALSLSVHLSLATWLTQLPFTIQGIRTRWPLLPMVCVQ
jgi:hypothetical protein